MPRTILIVDDISINREILKTILGPEYKFLEAENGQEAMALLTRHHKSVSAVLLDLVMPVMDGFDVIRQMRESSELAQIPVIVMTSNSETESEARALSRGANDYIVKPYNAVIVRQRLRNMINLRETSATVNAMQRDRLTGLLNREAFFDKAAEEIKAHKPGYFILSCINIDNFKVINDQYGTNNGDLVLKHAAGGIEQFTSASGGLCGRIMADNFAALYPAAENDSIMLNVSHQLIMNPAVISHPIGIRIGRYVVDDLTLPPSAMYDRASLAERSIKGRFDTYTAVYDEHMRTSVLQEQEIVNGMNGALRDRQFEVWFQPQYNHSTGALVGAEALVRWRHPRNGLVSPGVFIPIFEKNGFIYELDKFVWEESCRCLRKWTDEGRRPLPVSVNVSRYDIFRPDLVEVILKLVGKYDIPTELLRLEITESAFAKSTEQIVSVVKTLIGHGFTVEIDDFGSGYSSLNTLKSVPAQIIKLDMRFMEDDGTDRGGNIIESVVRMSKWLGMAVIAEGVEDIAQADFLKSIGCNYVQGYLYAKPMPVADYEALCCGIVKEERLLSLETVENLDNNAFWNPKSMDTLIFNSYVGSACIFEFSDGRIEVLRVTDKYVQMIGGVGLTTEATLRLDWGKYLDDDSRRRVREALEQSIAKKEDVSGEYTFIDLPGCAHETYLRSSMRVIATVGSHCLVYCINENITAQRQAEREARKAAEQQSAIMANINGGVTATVIKDNKAEYLFVNDKYYEQLGYTREQFREEIGSDPFVLVHPDDRQRVIALTAKASAEQKPFSIDYRVIRRDGSVRWMLSNISLMSLPEVSEPVQLSVANDITEQRTAEQKQLEMSAQLQAIMKNVKSGITAIIIGREDKFLFANDKYFEILGYTRKQFEHEVSDVFLTISDEDREYVIDRIKAKDHTGESLSVEFRAVRRDKTLVWLNAKISVTHFPNIKEPVQLAIYTDISAEKKAQQEIQETDEHLRFLNDAAHNLLSQPDCEVGIEQTLTGLLNYFNGTRAYIFEFDTKRRTAVNTYEICAAGVNSEIQNLRNVPIEAMSYWLGMFEQGKNIFISETDAIDNSRSVEREILKAQGIRALIAVPLRRDGRLLGFVGIDDPARQDASISRLDAIGDYLSVMLTRRDLQNKIESDRRAAVSLMNDTPGGFVRMHVLPDRRIVPVMFNDGFYKLVGMDYTRLMELYGNDAMAGVHPEDIHIVYDALKLMREQGEARSEKYRLRHGNGGYVWVMFFGRVIRDESGEIYLNIYYTDMSEQVKNGEKQKELLDNLPCGAALFEYDGARLSVVHLNNRYKELTGRNVKKAGVTEVIHPDDVALMLQELDAAVRQGRDGSCDIRILSDGGEFRPFHVSARILDQGGGRYSVCVTYTPISDEAMSIQEMLPVALDALMSASSDFTYVKDKNLRYVCCSRSFARLVGVSSQRDVIGKSDYELFEKRLADKYTADDRKIIENGESINDCVEEMPTDNGKTRYANTSKYLLRDSLGKLIGLYGFSRDITLTLEKESELKLLTDSIPGGIAIYEGRPDALDKIRLSYFSDGFCRLFGYTREEYEKLSDVNPLGLVFTEDIPQMLSQVSALVLDGKPMDCVYRARIRDGGYKWINIKAVIGDKRGDNMTVNAVLFDVTERQTAIEGLRISEEANRLAMQHTGRSICRYNVADKTLTIPEANSVFPLTTSLQNVPYGPVERNEISPDTRDAYIRFFESILHGESEGNVTYQRMTTGGWRWLEADFTTIFSDDGAPVSAVVSYSDITEQMNKEAVYKKWQQSFDDKSPDTYTLFRCNLSRDASYDSVEGTLINVRFDESEMTFDERTAEYVRQSVYEGDCGRYLSALRANNLLANFHRGKRSDVVEYREKLPEGGYRWLRLTIDLVEHPNSKDVEAYLMYENIDDKKKAELTALERAQIDTLTGVYNREAFISKTDSMIKHSPRSAQHALLMLDLDGFKLVNDVFGHDTGDQALADTAKRIRSVLGSDDLLGRLGGDEFVVFISNIPNDSEAANTAQKICVLTQKAFSAEVQISASVGISVCPRDGRSFSALYKKADIALYHVKGSGKNDYAFYRDDIKDENLVPEKAPHEGPGLINNGMKRRMLIVDDSELDFELMKNIFRDNFIIDKAPDGNSALIRLRHYGSAISIVLLDLFMPGMDGFAVLSKMRESSEMMTIPVVVVSGDEQIETSLRAIKAGASDFVTKPYDPELLRIRVLSAISKSENDHLRVQNSYLQLKNDEADKYRVALRQAGMAVIENDWVRGTFTYDPDVSAHLAGIYDGRKLWRILLSDMVADTATVQKMQSMMQSVAGDRECMSRTLYVQLKTPSRVKHWFRMTVHKRANAYQLTDKLILTFVDVGTEPPEE